LPLTGICVVTLKDGTRFHGICLDESVSFQSSTNARLLLRLDRLKAGARDRGSFSLITIDGSIFTGVRFTQSLRFATPAGEVDVQADQLSLLRGVTEEEADDLRYYLINSLRAARTETLSDEERVTLVERFYLAGPDDAPSKAEEAFAEVPIPPASFRRFLKTYGLVPEDLGNRPRWRKLNNPSLFRDHLKNLRGIPQALKDAWVKAANIEARLRIETHLIRHALAPLFNLVVQEPAYSDWMHLNQGHDLVEEGVNWTEVDKGMVLTAMKALERQDFICSGTVNKRQEWLEILRKHQATAPSWNQTTIGRKMETALCVVGALILAIIVGFFSR
jgi:hypothetical protein